MKKAVIAACVLHNICIDRGDMYDANTSDSDDSSDDEGGNVVLETGDDIRNTLRDYGWDNL